MVQVWCKTPSEIYISLNLQIGCKFFVIILIFCFFSVNLCNRSVHCRMLLWNSIPRSVQYKVAQWKTVETDASHAFRASILQVETEIRTKKIGAKIPLDYESKQIWPFEVNLSMIGYFNRMVCNPFWNNPRYAQNGWMEKTVLGVAVYEVVLHIFLTWSTYMAWHIWIASCRSWHFIAAYKCNFVEVANMI